MVRIVEFFINKSNILIQEVNMDLLLLAPIGSVFALIFAGYLAYSVVKKSEGTEQMAKIAAAIRQGANAYLKRQYTGVAIFFAVMVVILSILAFLGYLTPFVPFAFLTGGFFLRSFRFLRYENSYSCKFQNS